MKTNFNSERFDDSKLLKAVALYSGEERAFTFYSKIGSGVQSPVFKV